MKLEKRIYVVLPATVEVGRDKYVTQPEGRQVAQACHVVSKLRIGGSVYAVHPFKPITTIILACRDSKELVHVYSILTMKHLSPVLFSDENEGAYGNFKPITALAVYATPTQVFRTLDYLPLWGSNA